ERCFPCLYRNRSVDIVAVAPKHRMLAGADNDIEVARLTAVRPGVTLSRDANALTVPRTRLHPHFERLRVLHDSFAVADRTRGLGLARAIAGRTRHVELHAPAGLRNMSFAAARGASPRRAHYTVASAVAASIEVLDVDLHHRAANRVPETDVDLVFEIAARLRTAPHACSRASAEDARKDVPKTPPTGGGLSASAARVVGKIKAAEVKRLALCLACTAPRTRPRAEPSGSEAPASSIGLCRRRIDIVGVETELIVDLALLGIAQDVVGFGDIFETLFSFLIA